MANVLTYLYNCGDLNNPIDSQLTDADGKYHYDGLAADCYRIQFVSPEGSTFIDNEVVDATGWSEPINIDFGQCEDQVTVCLTQEVFDLALTKTLAPTQSATVLPGGAVDYLSLIHI